MGSLFGEYRASKRHLGGSVPIGEPSGSQILERRRERASESTGVAIHIRARVPRVNNNGRPICTLLAPRRISDRGGVILDRTTVTPCKIGRKKPGWLGRARPRSRVHAGLLLLLHSSESTCQPTNYGDLSLSAASYTRVNPLICPDTTDERAPLRCLSRWGPPSHHRVSRLRKSDKPNAPKRNVKRSCLSARAGLDSRSLAAKVG